MNEGVRTPVPPAFPVGEGAAATFWPPRALLGGTEETPVGDRPHTGGEQFDLAPPKNGEP
jgi:hypothetical protein